MRTTIDLPDQLFKKAKIEAIERGVSLKELFIQALEKELSSEQYRKLLELAGSERNGIVC